MDIYQREFMTKVHTLKQTFRRNITRRTVHFKRQILFRNLQMNYSTFFVLMWTSFLLLLCFHFINCFICFSALEKVSICLKEENVESYFKNILIWLSQYHCAHIIASKSVALSKKFNGVKKRNILSKIEHNLYLRKEKHWTTGKNHLKLISRIMQSI